MDAVGLYAGDLLVHRTGDYALKCDISILDDDVNRRYGTQLVLAQNAVAVDGTVGGAADAVVVDGGGQDLDIVDDLFYAFNALDYVFSIGLQGGTRDLAEQRHGAIR